MDARVAVLRAPGTNCDRETARALRLAGADAVEVSVMDLERGEDIMGYAGVVIPGGFSYGDRVRAGAIMAAKLRSSLGRRLEEFASLGRPILGICNGFQVLVELHLLPGIEGCGVALAPNASARFESRWVWVRGSGSCPLAPDVGVQPMPVAHGEGMVVFSDGGCLEEAEGSGAIAFRYVRPDGSPAGGEYPYNPNGSQGDVAGLCSTGGMDVMGLMPHPERAVFGWQVPTSMGWSSALALFKAFVGRARSAV